MLADRRHVLTRDSRGHVELWDVLTGAKVQSYGKVRVWGGGGRACVWLCLLLCVSGCVRVCVCVSVWLCGCVSVCSLRVSDCVRVGVRASSNPVSSAVAVPRAPPCM